MAEIAKTTGPMVKSAHQVLRGRTVPEWPSWSIKEASDATGYHPEYIRTLIRDGKVEAARVGRVFLVRISSLQEYMENLDKSDGRTGPR